MQKNYIELYPVLLYNFNDEDLLIAALSHPSLCFSKKDKCISYERLELLGDSVLSLVVTEKLFEIYPNSSEGGLSKRRAYLVSSKVLAEISKNINLGDYVYMTLGEEKMDGRNSTKILEDVMESVIGAIYLDGGLENARKFVLKYWLDLIKSLKVIKNDPKSRLQEWIQHKENKTPTYELVEGPDINNLENFKMAIEIENVGRIIGEGKNKKIATVNAAEGMINYIKQNIDENI